MSLLKGQLEESHKDLHQWFLLHQECLLLQQDEQAQQAFAAFEHYLMTHITFENDHVLSALQNAHGNLRWNITVYEKEHEKLLVMLGALKNLLASYYLLKGREKRLALLEVLDKQQSFYHVMEHHEEREEQDLFMHLHLIDVSVEELWLKVESELFEKYNTNKQSLKILLEQA
jgi:hypothetical protein